MRFAVETWAPEYGAPVDETFLQPTEGEVDTDAEVALVDWAPVTPATGPAASVAFVDGVRRVDARLWLKSPTTRPGLCASYAAGVVRCDGAARIDRVEVRRVLVCRAEGTGPITTRYGEYELHAVGDDAPDALVQTVQTQMRMLEGTVARSATDVEVVIVDGPLTYHRELDGAVGYVKTHHVAYLPPAAAAVVERLEPGQRTPVVVTQEGWARYLWYVRLPCAVEHGWAGIIRCEVAANRPVTEAAALADRVAVTVARFASVPHKDPRAPQNLYPIAALERRLRRRLGDPALVYRALRSAAAVASAPAT